MNQKKKKTEEEVSFILSLIRAMDGKNLRQLSWRDGTSAIGDVELGSCRRVKNPPLPSQNAYLLRFAKKKKLHRTQNDVSRVFHVSLRPQNDYKL